ncbi:hypothetical protein L210DRAFT_3433291, partial [Boletus edulis BED1]
MIGSRASAENSACCIQAKMVGRAYSKTKRKRLQASKQEEAIAEAVNILQEQMSKPEGTQQSIRKICSTVQERWQAKPGYKDIRV